MIQNPFENAAFDMASLTSAINILPNNYGKLDAMKLFPKKSVRTRSVVVEEQNGVLNLLPTQVPGGEATYESRSTRKMRSFTIPHIPHDDIILPGEVQGIRAFGQRDVASDFAVIRISSSSLSTENLKSQQLEL